MTAAIRTLNRAAGDSPDLTSYDRFIVAFSGGKDSVACVLTLLEAGVPPDCIELHHHAVDGQGPAFMDWPSTIAYCRAVALELGVPLYLSWKEGGFLREMLRDRQPTALIRFETPDGRIGSVGGAGPLGTRLRFPQVSADLRVRYCSAYLKVDVLAALIRAQPRFWHRRTLILTGGVRRRAGRGLATPPLRWIARIRATVPGIRAMSIAGVLSTAFKSGRYGR